MTDDELLCAELVELITDYLEGGLPDAERARFEAHLGECEACAGYLHQMRQTIALVGQLCEDDLAPAARDELLGRFRDWKRSA